MDRTFTATGINVVFINLTCIVVICIQSITFCQEIMRNAGVSAEYKLKENEVLKNTSSPRGRI